MPPTATLEFQGALKELTGEAGRAVDKFVAGLGRLSEAEAYGFAADGYPQLLNPYAKASGELTAQWYSEQPAKPTPRGSAVFVPEPAPLPPAEQLSRSARWAVSRKDTAAALRGNATRIVMGQSRKTVVDNAIREGVLWTRVTQPGACGFCRMLAGRTAVYASEKSALLVVGTEIRTREGITGHSGKLRGNQPLDEPYHDNCDCYAEVLRDGVYAEPEHMAEVRNEYRSALEKHGPNDAEILKEFTAQDLADAAVIGAGAAAALSAVPTIVQGARAVGGVGGVAKSAGGAAKAPAGAAGAAAGKGLSALNYLKSLKQDQPAADYQVLTGPADEPKRRWRTGDPIPYKSGDGPALADLPAKDDDTLRLESNMARRLGAEAVPFRDSGAVNPHWLPLTRATDELWTHNCVRCVVAWELRRRGYDVQATAAMNGEGISRAELAQMWRRGSENGNYASWRTVSTHSARTMKQQSDNYLITNYPAGARGFVAIGYKQKHGGGAHVFAWERIGDDVVYFDPQVPAEFQMDYDAADTFDMATPVADLEFIRTDELFPSGTAAELVLPRLSEYPAPTPGWIEQNGGDYFLEDGKKVPWTDEGAIERWWSNDGDTTVLGKQWMRLFDMRRTYSEVPDSNGNEAEIAEAEAELADLEDRIWRASSRAAKAYAENRQAVGEAYEADAAALELEAEQWQAHIANLKGEDLTGVEDYGMAHRPPGPDSGAPIHDLNGGESGLPDDVYDKPQYYDNADPGARRNWKIFERVRGNPDAMVTVYRAVPEGVTEINSGDWVSIRPEYAAEQGMHHDDPALDMPVISAQVPASSLFTNGDSLDEFGYWGPAVENGGTVDAGGDYESLTGGKRGGSVGAGPGSTPVTGKFGLVAERLPAGTEIKPIYALNKDGSVKMTTPKLKDDGTWTEAKPQVDVAATWAAVSDDTLDENLRLALRQTQPWAVEAGSTWYPGVRLMATRLTKKYAKSFKQQHGVDLSPDILGGLISVFSRNNGWIRNAVGVRQYLDDPFAEKPKKNKKTGEITMVKPMHVTMTGGAEDLISFVKERHAAGERDDHAIVEAFFASYPTAPKPHRFWRSIMGDEDNSAIDRWMARVQLHTDDPEFAEKMRSATKTEKGVKNNYGYHRLEASIKRISREPEFAGFTATQLQAMPWVHLVGPDGVLGDIQDLSSDKAASTEAKRHTESMGWKD